MQTYRIKVPNKVGHKSRHIVGVLRQFWDRAGRRETHLLLLREFAEMKFHNPMYHTTPKYRARRKESAARIIDASLYRCFVCPNPAVAGHHIIQLQHGGTNTPINIVPVCNTCHADIHPWMPANEAPESRPLWG